MLMIAMASLSGGGTVWKGAKIIEHLRPSATLEKPKALRPADGIDGVPEHDSHHARNPADLVQLRKQDGQSVRRVLLEIQSGLANDQALADCKYVSHALH